VIQPLDSARAVPVNDRFLKREIQSPASLNTFEKISSSIGVIPPVHNGFWIGIDDP
jgi:hypothetical protein